MPFIVDFDLREDPTFLAWVDRVAKKEAAQAEIRGEVRGEVKVITRLLTKKFSELPREYAERLEAMGTLELEALCDRILSAATLEEVFS